MTFVDEYGVEQVIETTDVHPFWVVTDNPDLERAARDIVDDNSQIFYHKNLESGLNGFWVEAKDLRIGDVFLGANGEISTLTNIVRVEQEGGIDVFNFKVERNHNYYILAKEYEYGQTCVLVHNNDYTVPRQDPLRPDYDNGATHVDHILARALGGTDAPENLQLLSAETNMRKGGYEGQILRDIEAYIKGGLTPEEARAVVNDEIISLGISPPPRPMPPDILDQLPFDPYQ